MTEREEIEAALAAIERLELRLLVFWRDGKRHRYALRTTDKVRAEAAARALYADLTREEARAS